jgi:hypothetical protein
VVSFTVAVFALAPSQGTPTGTVAFTDGTTTIGSVTLNNVGRATFTTASLSRGNHVINASYQGDAKFLSSSHTGFGETVLQDATTATVTASATSAVVGTTITFTAVVQANSPGAGTATGTVIFNDLTTALGTRTLSGGQATFTTSTLALGSHAITASYVGDTNFLAGVSAILAETVTSSDRALSQIAVLNGSSARAAAPGLAPQPATSPLTTPEPQSASFKEPIVAPSVSATPGSATPDPEGVDRFFAAARRATPRHDPPDWPDDPFLPT